MGGPNSRASPDGTEAFPTTQCYRDWALRLLEMGYEPLPIKPCSKAPAPTGWTTVPIDTAQVEAWSRQYPDHGIGLRTGLLVAIDIDVLDPDRAHGLQALAIARFGPTLIRVGQWPKRLLLYRTEHPFPKMGLPQLDILARGQQLVAFGIHPKTGQPYDWPLGETPLDVGFDDLPLVDQAGLEAWLVEAQALLPPAETGSRQGSHIARSAITRSAPVRNAAGMVTDHRDGWLSSIAYHLVWDALDAGEAVDAAVLAERVWAGFVDTTDLARGKGEGLQPDGPADALRKVRDKLGLHAAGRLPDWHLPDLQPEDMGDLAPPDLARMQLSEAIRHALEAAMAWWSGDRDSAAPVVGIRATVGLGKSAICRDQIAAWQKTMLENRLPHRVLVVTPSHALAEEAAVDWAAKVAGPVAVLRGYEAHDPITQEPICRDHEMVRFALYEDLRVGSSVCYSSKTWQCPHLVGCLKQQNKRDVAKADVVLAPYDVLFTGLGAGSEPFGLLVIDEGCWQRAEHVLRGPPVEKLATTGLSAGLRNYDPDGVAAMADLAALRAKAQIALAKNGPGAVALATLSEAGLSAEDCDHAAFLEERCIRDPEIYPGMKPHKRRAVMAIVKRNEVARRLAAIWRAMAEIIGGQLLPTGLLRITSPHPETDLHSIVLHNHLRLAENLAGLPSLHLDATLRPELAQIILPGLQVTRIDAEQPHLHLTLVVGRFGKSTLCPSPDIGLQEQLRRQNRLREVVDHVRWEARRVGSGGVLVVTHKAIETAFAGIEGVRTAHFNAIAGLDQYRDVRLLVVVGRPLPSSEALIPLSASFFHTLSAGRYSPDLRAIRLRTGATARLRVVAHEDPQAELLRAAICDDEVIQAIGRGRGVNRTADNPLEVQVLADVALPLIHDRVVAWETIAPDILQRTLLAGIAVDSPGDAAVLHPDMFPSATAAESTLRRAGFNRHSPIGNIYRGMTVKSARYRRGGRGQAWQTAYWLDGSADGARLRLISVIGAIDGWEARV
jgi:Bifunctional DNA primase/polymerase, N-terminal